MYVIDHLDTFLFVFLVHVYVCSVQFSNILKFSLLLCFQHSPYYSIYLILGQLPCRAVLDPLIDWASLADFRSVYPIGDYIW